MEVYVLSRLGMRGVAFQGVFATLEGAKSAIPEAEVAFADPDEYDRADGVVIRATGYYYDTNAFGRAYRGSRDYIVEKHTVQP